MHQPTNQTFWRSLVQDILQQMSLLEDFTWFVNGEQSRTRVKDVGFEFWIQSLELGFTFYGRSREMWKGC